MREPEFLPTWYPQLLRNRRIVMLEAWGLVLLLLGLAVWALAGQRQAEASAKALRDVQAQLEQTGVDLAHLGDVENVKKELEKQAMIVQRLGVNVPASRILAELSELMPAQTSLLTLQIKTEQKASLLTDLERAGGMAPRVERKMLLHLVGLSPSDTELAEFMTKLVGVPFFGDVALVKASDHSEQGYLMRRFEVTFALNLDQPDLDVAGNEASADTAGAGSGQAP